MEQAGKRLGVAPKAPVRAGDLEEESIDLENRKALESASPEEVKEWQRELLEQLGAETCAFLRRRGAEKRWAEPQVKPRPKEEELKEPKELKPKPEESVSSVSLEFSMDGVEAMRSRVGLVADWN
ncbi:unnamed protein product [Effrenium voratum]|uniref:RPAP1 N-terminal domain-containing protein n=1 Tax=Effrenium voratum TaxID=2562239 RepID=A0AA36MN57_9DINO|nr:unnamed protein product [Effrenium voratum]CAJ1448484.1 unnamed protein product [Effrenium voratum]